MYLLYSFLLGAAFALSAPFFLWRGRSTGKYVRTFRARMGRLPAGLDAGGRPSIWVHAVSVGEVLAARPLIAPLRARFPGHAVFLSTTTVTGHAVAERSVPDLDGLFFAPFDFPGPVRRVLDALRPALLVILETEIWPNLIHEARRRGVRVAIVNGRISPRSFARYRRIRWFLRPVLAEVDLFLMQGEAHAQRILAMGAPPDKVSVPGNLKYDAVGDVQPQQPLLGIVGSRPERPLLVAGSTVEGEEPLVLRALLEARERVPDLGLVIAPRHPERFAGVPRLAEAAGLACVRRSALQPGAWRNGDVLLLDTLGELAQVYALATVAFVGGSLMPAGGHNVLEAAVAGKPIVVGPHMENFQEIADELLGEGALVQLRGPEELADCLTGLLADEPRRRLLGERARATIERNRGACARTVDGLARLVA